MVETYREEQEANLGEDMDNKHDTERDMEDEDENGFEMEIAMDDNSWEDEDELPDGTEDLSYL